MKHIIHPTRKQLLQYEIDFHKSSQDYHPSLSLYCMHWRLRPWTVIIAVILVVGFVLFAVCDRNTPYICWKKAKPLLLFHRRGRKNTNLSSKRFPDFTLFRNLIYLNVIWQRRKKVVSTPTLCLKKNLRASRIRSKTPQGRDSCWLNENSYVHAM